MVLPETIRDSRRLTGPNLLTDRPLPLMRLAFRIRDAISARAGVQRIGGLIALGIGGLAAAYLLYDNARNRIDSFVFGGTAFDQVDLAQRTLLAGGWGGTGYALGVRKLNLGPLGGRLAFVEKPSVEPLAVIRLVQRESTRYAFDGPDKLRIRVNLEDPVERLRFAEELLQKLETRHAA